MGSYFQIQLIGQLLKDLFAAAGWKVAVGIAGAVGAGWLVSKVGAALVTWVTEYFKARIDAEQKRADELLAVLRDVNARSQASYERMITGQEERDAANSRFQAKTIEALNAIQTACRDGFNTMTTSHDKIQERIEDVQQSQSELRGYINGKH